MNEQQEEELQEKLDTLPTLYRRNYCVVSGRGTTLTNFEYANYNYEVGKFITKLLQEQNQQHQSDIRAVLGMLKKHTDNKEISNYIMEYMEGRKNENT